MDVHLLVITLKNRILKDIKSLYVTYTCILIVTVLRILLFVTYTLTYLS
jgi:hypothetical protein